MEFLKLQEQERAEVFRQISKKINLNEAVNHVKNLHKNNLDITTNRIQEPNMIFEPDEDFYRSITMEEFKIKAREVVEKVYKRYTNERNNTARNTCVS